MAKTKRGGGVKQSGLKVVIDEVQVFCFFKYFIQDSLVERDI